MLKRKIAVIIAGGLFGAQIGLAAAQVTAVPENDELIGQRPLPAQEKYFAERAAAVQAEGAALQNAVPVGSSYLWGQPLPSQEKYFAERERAIAQEASRYAYPTVRIHPQTANVTVEHLGAVRFVDDNGHAFVWRADTLGETALPLKAVAPADFGAGNTEIYVRHPSSHIPG